MQGPTVDGMVARVSEEKLTHVVSTRFTQTETEQLRELAGERPISQLLRELALDRLHARHAVEVVVETSRPLAGTLGRVAATVSNFPGMSYATGGWVDPTAIPASALG